MTYDLLKSLRTEDFMAPNQVLCYGGGEAFQRIAPSMISRGINVVGVIDKNKKGTVAAGGRELPYLSVEKAMDVYGNVGNVIVTIADEKVFQEVKQDLVDQGFSEKKIFDMNVWTWLTVPSEKSYCNELDGRLQIYAPALTRCCRPGLAEPFFFEWFMKNRPFQQSINNSIQKHLYYIEQSSKGQIPLYCIGCECLTQDSGDHGTAVTQFIISDHSFCNSDCVYCEYACSIPRQETRAVMQERNAAILYALEQVQQNFLDEEGVIRLEGGEITVNPYRNEILEAVSRIVTQSPKIQLQILSNCFIYDQKIADLLSLNKSSYLTCDLDAGIPETYIKVKGFNKFDSVRENLKKYAQHGTVKLKYIILPGWNDSQADFEGTVALLKELGSSELMLSPEFGISKEGSREKIRESLFAAAQLMALLEREGIHGILSEGFWKTEYLAIAKRLCRELQNLQNEQREHV